MANPNIARITTACHTCGAEILKPPSLIRDRNFCSDPCYRTYRRTLKGDKSAEWMGGKPSHPCTVCGVSVLRNRSDIRKYANTFCSRKCRTKWSADCVRGENASNWRGGPTDRTCIRCGSGFQLPRCDDGKYCTKACYLASRRDAGCESPYARGWNDRVRAAIKRRDGRRCATCQGYKNLVVHHRDFGKSDHSLSNLITLCRVCHGKVHARTLLLLT